MFHRTNSSGFLVCCLKAIQQLNGVEKNSVGITLMLNHNLTGLIQHVLYIAEKYPPFVSDVAGPTEGKLKGMEMEHEFSDVPLLPEMCCWNYPNSQCFVCKLGFPETFCNWFTTRIE